MTKQIIRIAITLFMCMAITSNSSATSIDIAQTETPVSIPETLADGQFVYGPNVVNFDLKTYLEERNSSIAIYADDIDEWARYASVNPMVILTLLELKSSAVTSTVLTQEIIGQAAGYPESDFSTQVKYLSTDLALNFYKHLYSAGSRRPNKDLRPPSVSIEFKDQSVTKYSGNSSSGSYAVASTLAKFLNEREWQSTIESENLKGFIETYKTLFPENNPLDNSNNINPASIPPADFFQFPFTVGETWFFNGMHNFNGDGTVYGRPFSSIDFFTGEGTCANPPTRYATAARGGTLFHCNAHFCWVEINHGDGWTTSYYHLRNTRADGGINRNDSIGQIACELCAGGSATIPHVHFSLLYNGAYTDLDGIKLSFWTIHTGDGGYKSGYIERNGIIKTPYQTVLNDYDSYLSSGTGNIHGYVKDSSTNTGLSGANVMISGGGTTKNSSTDANGFYSFSNVPAISSSITASKSGYSSETVNFSVIANQNAQAPDIYLKPPEPPASGWNETFYSDNNLGSQCGITRNESDVYMFRDTDAGWSPPSGCPNSDQAWSVRMIRSDAYFSGGNYEFGLFYDDNARLYVDGQLVVDGWNTAQHYESKYLSAGNHELKLEYKNNIGHAIVQLWWRGPGALPYQTQVQDHNQWWVNYWGNQNQWQDSVGRGNEGVGNLDRNWGNGGPGFGIPSDHFSMKFERTIYFDCGTYSFHLQSDDGSRLWINNVSQPQFDHWITNMWNTTSSIFLDAGYYNIRIDYFENGGEAGVSFDWSLISECAKIWVLASSVKSGEPVQVWWTDMTPSDNDWISIHPSDQPDSNYLGWKFAIGESGSLIFNAPGAPGYYDFRLFRNGTKIATSNSFEVVDINTIYFPIIRK